MSDDPDFEYPRFNPVVIFGLDSAKTSQKNVAVETVKNNN
jgi:hypothetical protein